MQSVPAKSLTITFRGYASKKNQWRPRKGGKGIFLDRRARLMIERMELQVPAEARDLKLEHPNMIWSFQYTNGHIDRDGIIATVLDILQKYGVITNDDISHCNGQWTIFPALRGEYDEVTVTLYPQSNVGQVKP